MKKYLSNNELLLLEQKYMNILMDIMTSNLGNFISQVYTQNLIMENRVETDTVNQIEGAVENIIESMITERLHWKVCSLAASADSCFECGDAIIHIDAKTMLLGSENDTLNVEKNQTSYIEGEILYVGRNKNTWTPNLKCYENHQFYGFIPNLTYVIRVFYSVDNLVERVVLLCLPNGQFGDIFNRELILNAGKSKGADGSAKNIRFNLSKIISVENQAWRSQLVFDRKKSETVN